MAKFSAISRTQVEGPDFICVGMIKAGTAWLFEQLKYHPDFWMPPVKEIRYLGARHSRMTIVNKRHERFAGKSGRKDRARGRDERDLQFLQEAAALSGNPGEYARYAALFRHKGDQLSGDISPMYSRLGDDSVGEIAQHLPDTKIVLLIRDPVARAWSGVSMLHRHGRFDASLLEDLEQFKSWFRAAHRSERRSAPSDIVRRWQQHAPEVAFRYFFFDDIVTDAEKARREILLYLGADPEKKSGSLPASHNRKAEAKKLLMTDEIKAFLVEHFSDELRASAELLGGPAEAWLQRYGLSGSRSLK
ncbi:MAG TPA: sulfotransferase [Rhizomicrobium sp.]|nr:sulfotransferase [Rhizomicrobium sp.]